jgi:hypothetical protein
MKTTLSLMAILVFSAIMLAPKIPKEYPPKEVLEQRAEIVLKEKKLDHLIDNMEYIITVDKMNVEALKQSNIKQN